MQLTKAWAPYFQSGVRARGRALCQNGSVHLLSPNADELIRAQVRGKTVHTVTLRQEGSTVTPHCDCPHFAAGAYCEHLWATLLHSERHEQESESGPGELVQAIGLASPMAPKATKRAAGGRNARRGDPEWIERLSLLRPVTLGPQAPAPPAAMARQVCYVVNTELSGQHNGLVVELCQRQPTAVGWSRLKPLKISAATLAEIDDTTDRELCALILGATWVGTFESGDAFPISYQERARASFRLLPGAWRGMLKRLIETRRCFIDTGSGNMIPLIWDGPKAWTPWLVAELVDAHLESRLELRREHQRLPVSAPRLILGGPDGLLIHEQFACPFDDRGAWRWVVYFREDRRGRSEPPPIRVPLDEVPRFLDRLYMLANLPEVDLPEGLGRPEVHMAPVPNVEIFSPPTNGKAAPGRVRGQLGARLWFAYGATRIPPGQSGRFVPVIPGGPGIAASGIPAVAEEVAAASRLLHEEAEGPSENENDAPSASQGDQGFDEPENPHPTPPATRPGVIRRDPEAEHEAISLMAGLGFRQGAGNGSEPLTLPARQLPVAVEEMIRRGWTVTADQRAVRGPGAARLSVASGIDWFELHGGIHYKTENGDQEVSLPEILAAARAGKHMVTLGDGSQGLLPEQWLKAHGMLAAIGKSESDHLVFKNSQAALLDRLLDDQPQIQIDDRFAALRQRLRRFDGVEGLDPEPTFKGTLRPYQREGLGWMRFLRWFGMGGVLADDMGLGKTIQVLAMLDARYRPTPQAAGAAGAGAAPDEPDRLVEHRPSLIVVPRSVVFNWVDEAQKFAPALRVQAYTGAGRDALRRAFADHDAIVTSYGLMRRDIAELRDHPFEYVILDEAQAIKNPDSQSAKAARLLQARHRLVLTGTPVENHLGDLWSIFEFLNPGTLGSNTRFAQLIRGGLAGAEPEAEELDPDQQAEQGLAFAPGIRAIAPRSAEAAVQIAQALRPFILRRTKKQVLADLPEKTEQTILCEMEPEQRSLYDQLLRHYRATLLGNLESPATAGAGSVPGGVPQGTGAVAPMMVLEALLRLRQASCHPGLIDPQRAGEPSAKLEALLDMLTEIIDEGHKTLVFSQFTSMLAIVRKRLDQIGISYEYLDGQTRDRKKHVERFQSDPACPVFLISLKAGGLGLNLTAAEYVFILDPWWNPAVEAQAIDRAHRIGQTRHVFAYRLICQDTVEQRIAQLQEKKKLLADAIIGGQGNLLANLTRADLEALLS